MLERDSATSTRTAEAPVVKVAANSGPKMVVAGKEYAPSRLSKMTAPAEADAAHESVKAVTAEAMTNVRDRIVFPDRTTERGFIIVGSIVSRKIPNIPPHVESAPAPARFRGVIWKTWLNVKSSLRRRLRAWWPALQRLYPVARRAPPQPSMDFC
jgi:hypothetical protein